MKQRYCYFLKKVEQIKGFKEEKSQISMLIKHYNKTDGTKLNYTGAIEHGPRTPSAASYKPNFPLPFLFLFLSFALLAPLIISSYPPCSRAATNNAITSSPPPPRARCLQTQTHKP